MIIIEIIFAKINNPQQTTKHFAKKISTNQCKLYSCVLSLVPCYMTEILNRRHPRFGHRRLLSFTCRWVHGPYTM